MAQAQPTGDAEFLRQFDAPRAIIGNIVVHVVSVVPVSLYVLAAPSLMSTFEVGAGSIGTMLSTGMLMAAITALFIGSNAYRLNLRYTAALGMVIHISGHVIALNADAWAGIVLARGVSAIGDSMTLSAANAVLGRSSNATRYWALSSVATGLTTAVGSYLLGLTLDGYGPDIFFAGMIAIGVLAVPLAWFLPTHTLPADARVRTGGNIATRLFAAMGSGKGLAILLGTMLLSMGNTAIFSFSAIIGKQAGLTTEEIGSVASFTYAAMTVANLGVAFIAAHFGHARPLFLLAVVFAVSSFVLGAPSSLFTYAAAMIGLTVAYRASTPYAFGISSKQDPGGGIAASLIVFAGLGNAIGPSLTPLILGGSNDYRIAAIVAAAIFVSGAVTLAVIALGLERRARSGSDT